MWRKLEDEINAALQASYERLKANPVRWWKLEVMYREAVAAGFYEGEREREGEPPAKRPSNPAYMMALHQMWQPVKTALTRHGLRQNKTLRQLFATSGEFSGAHYDIRVFAGYLQKISDRRAVALFVLVVPHDSPRHNRFRLPKAPHVTVIPIW